MLNDSPTGNRSAFRKFLARHLKGTTAGQILAASYNALAHLPNNVDRLSRTFTPTADATSRARDTLALMTKNSLPHARKVFTTRDRTYLRWRFVTNAAPTMRRYMSRRLFADTSGLVDEIRKRGIIVGPSAQLLSDAGQSILARVSQEILAKADSREIKDIVEGRKPNPDPRYNYLLELTPRPPDVNSPLLKLALDPKILEIASNYLGMWPRLTDAVAWLNFPTAEPAKEAQLWHRDPEDELCLKVFIYLVDVDEEKGPFSYLRGSQPLGTEAYRLPDRDIRVPDERMRTIFPEEDWFACTGPAGTIIMADTIGYHRGGKSKSGNRVLLTFAYTSNNCPWPLRVVGTPEARMTALQRFVLEPSLRRGADPRA
jgi:hypothetical protein